MDDWKIERSHVNKSDIAEFGTTRMTDLKCKEADVVVLSLFESPSSADLEKWLKIRIYQKIPKKLE